jgi:glutamate-1-semialdehyde 2,1-aminomutase
MNAIRLARAVTGRDRVLKFDWGYHGSWEGLPSVRSEMTGIPDCILALIEWVDYNDADGIGEAMARRPGEIAAIIVEPLLGAGVIPGEQAFLEAARRAADDHGALLIFDEVVSLRIAWGGVQSEVGVLPDLTTFGKVIGGGLPVGALGGAASLMSRFDPRAEDAIPHHGTFNGNVMTTTAGVTSLDLLTKDEVARINRLGERLADGLNSLSGDGGPDVVVTQAGSLVQAHFDAPAEIRSGSDLRPGSEALSRFHRAALDHGVYMAPRGEFNVTTAMDEAIVDEAIDGLRAAYSEL